ncbi:AI-2E family transporter [Clostridium ganghwense]|uniref:AI-2E family transporter n=1 Tax=Clostridium ganghwense TaxID=312089 RepID=A0ABT4CK09_9CLOT|nr:AI-2E family transporter [Clostridium ganghwense]MCY6369384.1 AI-2E family transporter [Clostridium ganghwense]
MKLNRFYKYSIGIILILIIMLLFSYMPFLVEALEILIRLIFYPFIIGGLLYYMLRPIIRFFDSKNVNRNISVLIVFLLIVSIFAVIGVYGGVSIREQFLEFSKDILDKFQEIRKNAEGILKNRFDLFINVEDLKERAWGFLESGLRGAKTGTVKIISRITNFISIILLIPIVVFFLLRDDEKLSKNFFKNFSLKNEKKFKIVLKHIDKTLSTYISGRLIVCIVIGIFTFIGYLIIKLPNYFILSIITMIFSIIPVVGPIISIIPALIIAAGGGLTLIVKVLIVTFIVQQIEGNLVTPKVIGENLQIHPLTIIFLVVVSVTLLGFIGGLISIPVYAVIKVIIRDVNEFWVK